MHIDSYRYVLLRRIEIVKQNVQQNLSNEATDTSVDVDVDDELDEKDLTPAEKEMMAPVKSNRSKQLMTWLKRLSSNYVLVVALVVILVVYYIFLVPIYFTRSTKCSGQGSTQSLMGFVYNAYIIFLAVTFFIILVIDFFNYAKDLCCGCGIRKTFYENDPFVYRIEMLGSKKFFT